MNVRAGSHARDRAAKRREGNPVAAQEVNQRLAFGPIRIQREVHRIAMIEMPLVVNRALSEYGDR